MVTAETLGRAVRGLFFLAAVGFLAVILVGPVIAVISVAVSLALSALAVLLPFALVGLVLWVPYQILSRNPATAWANIRASGVNFLRRAGALLNRSFQLVRWSVRRALVHLGLVRPVARSVTARACDAARAAANVSIKACDAARTYGPVVVGACARGARRVAEEGEAVGSAVLEEGRSFAARVGPWLRYLGSLFLEVVGGAAVGGLLLGLANLGQDGLEERIALGVAIGAAVAFVLTLVSNRPAWRGEGGAG